MVVREWSLAFLFGILFARLLGLLLERKLFLCRCFGPGDICVMFGIDFTFLQLLFIRCTRQHRRMSCWTLAISSIQSVEMWHGYKLWKGDLQWTVVLIQFTRCLIIANDRTHADNAVLATLRVWSPSTENTTGSSVLNAWIVTCPAASTTSTRTGPAAVLSVLTVWSSATDQTVALTGSTGTSTTTGVVAALSVLTGTVLISLHNKQQPQCHLA